MPNTPGNINLYKQPKVKNPDGSTSTVDSVGVNINGKEYLLPTVTPDGRHFVGPNSVNDAVKEFRKTGLHLGIFNTPEESNTYAEQLHNDYAAGKYNLHPGLWGTHPMSSLGIMTPRPKKKNFGY